MTALYRRYIREALTMAEPFPLTEAKLADLVAELAPGQFDLSTFRDAVEWNLAQDFIRSEINEDTDEKEWRFTKLGKAKAAQD